MYHSTIKIMMYSTELDQAAAAADAAAHEAEDRARAAHEAAAADHARMAEAERVKASS
jgi:hypothetical protein